MLALLSFPKLVCVVKLGHIQKRSCHTDKRPLLLTISLVVYEIAPMIQPLGINSHLNPVNTQWASHEMTDPALCHGILFHASVHIESCRKGPWISSTLFHRGETIRLVSEGLKDSDQSISDNTIASVGWVAAEGVNLPLGSCTSR